MPKVRRHAPVGPTTPVKPQPINGQPSGLKPKKGRIGSLLPWVLSGVGAVLLGTLISMFIWYNVSLSPKAVPGTPLVKVDIASGSNIGQLLESKGVIRNGTAFRLYTILTGSDSKLQAGTYRLDPSQSVGQIVSHLKAGSVDTFSLTFLPGATLADDEQVLLKAGYSQDEINTGLAATYDSPALANKPSGTSFEGYMYGDTYQFNAGASVQTIIQRLLDQLSAEVTTDKLVAAYQSHGLNLYQGITLASIIQKEASNPNDQKQVAQVFYLRLQDGMQLGSDVTYMYAAKLLGVTPSPTLDSPYNTRIYPGLPPGPISNPSKSALEAAAHPASGDYLYFVAGDNGKIYFATTEAQHEANIAQYCSQNCN